MMTDNATRFRLPTPVDEEESLNTKQMRRILASSFLGSAIEFYDFILYATAAAIVFNHVFFAGLGPGFAVFASFGTLAAGYIARPLGGVIFGHFGDKIGRKRMLVLSMLIMGLATAFMGVLPPTAEVGIISPVLLVLLRIVQGLAVGGEWGGAMLVALEHAPGGKRGLAASFANMGGPAGAVLATIVVSAFTTMPDEQFLNWGWRIPFLLSLALVLIGLAVRMKVAETPLFQQMETEADARRIPMLEVITKYPRNLILGILAGLGNSSTQGIMTVWAVSYVVAGGLDNTGVLIWKALGALAMLVVTFFSARLSDRLGRRPVMVSGMILGAFITFPVLGLLEVNALWAFGLAVILSGAVCQGIMWGPYAAFTAELFPTRVRYTGASMVFQTASTFGAGFSPAIAAWLLIQGEGSTWMIGVLWASLMLAGAGAAFLAKEGLRQDLSDIRQ